MLRWGLVLRNRGLLHGIYGVVPVAGVPTRFIEVGRCLCRDCRDRRRVKRRVGIAGQVLRWRGRCGVNGEYYRSWPCSTSRAKESFASQLEINSRPRRASIVFRSKL